MFQMKKSEKPTFKILGYASLRKCRCYFQGDHDTTRKNVIPAIDWSNKDEVLTQ